MYPQQFITYGTRARFAALRGVPACVFLVVFFLAGTLSAVAQPNVGDVKKHPCPEGVEFVTARSEGYSDDWSIVVVCDRSQFESYEKSWEIRINMGAFTVLNAKRTILPFDLHSAGVKRQDLTLFLIAHELRHIRCMCDLGEGKGRQ